MHVNIADYSFHAVSMVSNVLIFRIMLLNLLNLFSLIIALFKKIYSMNQELDKLRHCNDEKGLLALNDSTTLLPNAATTIATDINLLATTSIYGIVHAATSELFPNILPKLRTIATTMAMATTKLTENVENITQCVQVVVNCSKISKSTTKSVMTSFLALNFTTTILPEIMNQLNGTEFNSTTISPWDMDSDIFHSSQMYFDFDFDNNTEYNASTTVDANDVYPTGSSTTTSFSLDGIVDGNYETTTLHSDEYEYNDDYGKFVSESPQTHTFHGMGQIEENRFQNE